VSRKSSRATLQTVTEETRKPRKVQKQVTKPEKPEKQEIITEIECRNRHVSIHNPNLEVHFCNFCQANVTVSVEMKCTCCFHNVPKVAKNNYARLEKVLNKALRDYGFLADDYASFPCRKPVTLEIGLGSQVYHIDLKYVALWIEPINKEDKLRVIAKNYRLYGLRAWIPDDD